MGVMHFAGNIWVSQPNPPIILPFPALNSSVFAYNGLPAQEELRSGVRRRSRSGEHSEASG